MKVVEPNLTGINLDDEAQYTGAIFYYHKRELCIMSRAMSGQGKFERKSGVWR